MNEEEHGYYKRFFEWKDGTEQTKIYSRLQFNKARPIKKDNEDKSLNEKLICKLKDYADIKVRWFIKNDEGVLPVYDAKVSGNVKMLYRSEVHQLVHETAEKLKSQDKITAEKQDLIEKTLHRNAFKFRQKLKRNLAKTHLEFLQEKVKKQKLEIENLKSVNVDIDESVDKIKSLCNREMAKSVTSE